MTQEKQDRSRDLFLGMDQPITRRDFLNGIAIGAAAAASGPLLAAAPSAAELSPAAQDALGYYPPLLTGLRGNHPGSFEDAHALRDGNAEQKTAGPSVTDKGLGQTDGKGEQPATAAQRPRAARPPLN